MGVDLLQSLGIWLIKATTEELFSLTKTKPHPLQVGMGTLLRRAVRVSTLPESETSERLCQLPDVSEDILCVLKDIVSLKATFTTGLHKILHIGQ